MAEAPEVIVFDVNETLSDMSPMGGRFADAGAPEQLAKLWIAMLLREGFAPAAAGDAALFGEIGPRPSPASSPGQEWPTLRARPGGWPPPWPTCRCTRWPR
ncbi:hypothetical protein [Sinomonas albida]|uniref:hypothetical protein n=1 Tax=Sinomonas albida TaxID=369942 RepID=UPI0030164548